MFFFLPIYVPSLPLLIVPFILTYYYSLTSITLLLSFVYVLFIHFSLVLIEARLFVSGISYHLFYLSQLPSQPPFPLLSIFILAFYYLLHSLPSPNSHSVSPMFPSVCLSFLLTSSPYLQFKFILFLHSPVLL